MDFKLKLIDVNPIVVEEFELQFDNYPKISKIENCYFEEVEEYDCIVSPANSFGMMDGGLDAAIINYFGKDLEKRVQKFIIENYSGEQPIGTSFVIETNNTQHPFLAHTPTMRTPQNIKGTLNVYYAMKSMLNCVKKHNELSNQKINSVLCTGFGTYIGEMQPYKAVEQMVLAYEHFLKPPKSIDVEFILKRTNQMKGIL